MKGLIIGAFLVVMLAACGGRSRPPAAATSPPPATPSSAVPVPSSAEPSPVDSAAPSSVPSSEPSSESSSDDATAGFPATYRVTRVNTFEQYQGQPGWVPNEQAQVENSVWDFDRDGTFSFTTSNVRTDLFPLHGTYQVQGSELALSAHATSTTGTTGSANAELIGTMDTSASPPTIQFRLIVGSGNGAVVDGQTFSGATTSAFGGTITVSSG